MSKTSWYALSLVSVLCLFAIAWTCVPTDGRPAEESRDNPMWCAVRDRLQQAIDYVGLPIRICPEDDPNERLSVLFNESENIGQLREEWKRFWETDMPSHLTPERVHGGIMP